MERAAAVARGEGLDSSGAVRSFGFSTLLLPFFALAQWLELESLLPVVHLVRGLQMVLGLGLVLVCARLGARLGGPRVGYVAGFFVAVNPVFLRYSVSPVAGVAAALCVALALDCLLVRGSLRRALAGGLALGAAFLCAYQTLLIALPLLVLLVARDRRRHARSYLGAGAGLALGVGLQVALDRLTYGAWGVSIETYLIENVGGVVVRLLHEVGLDHTRVAREYYASFTEVSAREVELEAVPRISQLQSPLWYLTQLPRFLVLPVLFLGLWGVLRAWLQMNWKSSVLFLVLAANVLVMSAKGAKSFRLWLPLLPLVAPLCAWGWGALRGLEVERAGAWRRWAAGLALCAGLVMGLATLERSGTRSFGSFWDAMEFVNGEVAQGRTLALERGEEPRGESVSSSYDWAVFGRARAGLRHQKLREHLDSWTSLPPERREAVLEQLSQTHWLILHGSLLRVERELTTAINENFEVAASFWDEDTAPELRDVRVLRNLRHPVPAGSHLRARQARRLWEVLEGVEPESYRFELQLERGVLTSAVLVGSEDGPGPERLELLGFECEELPGSGLFWVTYHWYSATGFRHDYALVDRVTTRQCPWAWQNVRAPGHGCLPTSEWRPGWIVRESYVLLPGHRPFEREGFRPLGGAYRRGDLLPASLWLGGEGRSAGERPVLRPADARDGRPLAETALVERDDELLESPAGHLLSPDGLVRAGQFLLPVAPRFAWPDDGGPGPDAGVLLAGEEAARGRDEPPVQR